MIDALPEATLSEAVGLYGGDASAVRFLTSDGPELLPYATLLNARAENGADFGAVRAIYEWDDRPLIVLMDESQIRDATHLGALRRAAAMRGDAPYVGVIGPGRLTAYVVTLDDHSMGHSSKPLVPEAKHPRAFIPHLANTRPTVSSRYWISDVVLRLLTETIDAIISEGLTDGDAISLVGRALFVRFLADRSLLQRDTLPLGFDDPSTLFDSRHSVEATTKWLDETFNGDFLPLSRGLTRKLSEDILLRLGDVLRRAPNGQLSLGWQEKWDRLDFAHIPVGVLSQAYERYLSRHNPIAQRLEGGYYTPRHIADLMVRASFAALEQNGRGTDVRVLDPAAGAGVFLITAFRQLVAQHWKNYGKRPDTLTLRTILQDRITGFDINESALRFAALGLYLASIELDPNPEPIEKLRFDNLRPRVLKKVEASRRTDHRTNRDADETQDVPELGSLGPDVGPEHIGVYDLVLGNPPWASSTQLKGWKWLQERVNSIARNRTGDKSLIAPLPNEVLDLAFLWRSMEWAAPGGQIAFALHARILFQQGETMPGARDALLRCLDITGIINGAELRQTRVWPEISAPFCLLFARNDSPPPGAGFRFVTPRLDDDLNQAGAWRIDVTNAEIVTNEEARRRPTLLKTLFRGTRLDAEILGRIEGYNWPTLQEYWSRLFGEHRGKSRNSGNGFQRIRNSSRTRKHGDGLPGVSASYLNGLPVADAEDDFGLLIDTSLLSEFIETRIHDPRPIEIFQGPLLLVRESPPVRDGRMKISIAENDVAYSQSFHGYSAHEHPEGLALCKYISLLLSSKTALWRALMTSGRFGFEREVVEKFIVDELPVKPFEELKSSDKREIGRLFGAIAKQGGDQSWKKVDEWVASLYDLQDVDRICIEDTLRLNLPFAENRRLSQNPPSTAEVELFCAVLVDELREWGPVGRQTLNATPTPRSPMSPWQFVRLSRQLSRQKRNDPVDDGLMQAANVLAATELVLIDENADCLWLGRINQSRYWSHSQARLAARQIVWDHSTFLDSRTKN